MISKLELKKQLLNLGIKVQGNFVNREDVIKMLKTLTRTKGKKVRAKWADEFRKKTGLDEAKLDYKEEKEVCPECENDVCGDEAMAATTTEFAKVVWVAEDVKSLRPDWSDEDCTDFLVKEENHIQSAMVEKGWQVIEDLLDKEYSKEYYECVDPKELDF